jgi:hypothetical protein
MAGSRIPNTVLPRTGDCDCEGPITEANFRAQENLQEGISGRRSLDTTYENDDVDSLVNRPRSAEDFPESDKDKPWRNWK